MVKSMTTRGAGSANGWNSGIHDRKLKELICEIGRRVYQKGFAAANDGNISIRVGENEVICSPTMICKGFMTPEDICAVDLDGNQIGGKRKRTSEILLHLSIMKAREDVKAVVHCHPPHATAFAVAGEPIPQCVLPEVEVFMGEIPIAPYETPGGQKFADTVLPFLKGTSCIILKNHGTVSFGKTLEEAFWKTEILDSYCRILMLAKQLGRVDYFTQQQTNELLDLEEAARLRRSAVPCRELRPVRQQRFPPGIQGAAPAAAGLRGRSRLSRDTSKARQRRKRHSETDDLVQAITDQVMQALSK